jgi:hypothetical protein
MIPYSERKMEKLTDSMKQSHLQKLIVVQLLKKFPAFYETRKFIIIFSHKPATGHYPEPYDSSSHPHTLFL